MPPLASSNSHSFSHITDYAPVRGIGPTMVEPISTNLTTEQDLSLYDYGTFEDQSQWDDVSQDEVTFMVQPQDESSSPLPHTAKYKPTMSAPPYIEAIDLSPIPMSGFRRARQLFAPETSYLALLESQNRLSTPSKRHRLCVSHISVPPLPHDKAEYKTLSLLPKHKGSNFPEAKSPRKFKVGFTQKYEQALARYQPQGRMFVDSSSVNLRPITKFPRSENDSSKVVPTQRPSKVTPPLGKQHQLSTKSMESLLPQKKNSTVWGASGDVRP
ncbi:hypothetical protein IW261DRAFT_485767 [Armillaria novae-zelandiae]|uniref:Uncharacterized protein n=1 Tax=Armillaria novae-zelandiae TaxID=153914 RepID=A0AA39P0Z0_9AGAR|nr:hypothetical protein IW261DRAFT_485767 [Armillaria novae-zelandiae]